MPGTYASCGASTSIAPGAVAISLPHPPASFPRNTTRAAKASGDTPSACPSSASHAAPSRVHDV
eukprot:3370254-Rhodomonas_salina.1